MKRKRSARAPARTLRVPDSVGEDECKAALVAARRALVASRVASAAAEDATIKAVTALELAATRRRVAGLAHVEMHTAFGGLQVGDVHVDWGSTPPESTPSLLLSGRMTPFNDPESNADAAPAPEPAPDPAHA